MSDHLPNSWSFRIEEDEDLHPYPPVTVLIHQLTPTSGTLLIGTADRAWFAWWGMLEESITAFLCSHEPPVLLNALWPDKRDRNHAEVASLYRILRAIQERIVDSGNAKAKAHHE